MNANSHQQMCKFTHSACIIIILSKQQTSTTYVLTFTQFWKPIYWLVPIQTGTLITSRCVGTDLCTRTAPSAAALINVWRRKYMCDSH